MRSGSLVLLDDLCQSSIRRGTVRCVEDRSQILGHFALPFLVLLSADLKKKPRLLAWVALYVLAMRWLDFYWQVAPSVREGGIALHWLDPVVPIALGGLWLAILAGQLKKLDPRELVHGGEGA